AVDVAVELAEAQRREHGHWDDAHLGGGEESEDELVWLGDDDTQLVALAEAAGEEVSAASARLFEDVGEGVVDFALIGLDEGEPFAFVFDLVDQRGEGRGDGPVGLARDRDGSLYVV